MKRALPYALPALVLAALFNAPLLGAGLVWDDVALYNLQLPLLRGVADAFFHPPGVSVVETATWFRPVVWLSHLLDRALAPAGSAPELAHLTNLLCHGGVTLLLFFLARELFRRNAKPELAAGAAALFFALNPAHLESLGTIAGRTDLLATGFLLAALLAAARWRAAGGEGAWRSGALTSLFLLLALLSKETALVGLLLLPALVRALGKQEASSPTKRDYTIFYAVCAAAPLLWLLLRSLAHTAAPPLSFGPAARALALAADAAGFYLARAFLPYPWQPVYPSIPPLLQTLPALAALFVPFAFISAKYPGERSRMLFLTLLLAVPLAPPLLALFNPQSWTPVAERHLYLPSAAAALLLGRFAAEAALGGDFQRRALGLALLLLLCGYGAATYARAPVWTSDKNLWSAAAATPGGGKASRVLSNLGVALQREGDQKGAEGAFRRALAEARNPGEWVNSAYNLATALISLGEGEEAARGGELGGEALDLLSRIPREAGLTAVPEMLARANALKGGGR